MDRKLIIIYTLAVAGLVAALAGALGQDNHSLKLPFATISTQDDFRRLLLAAQADYLPQDNPIVVDVGDFAFEHDGTAFGDILLAAIMRSPQFMHIVVSEEATTGDTLLCDGAGEEIYRIPPPPGYIRFCLVPDLTIYSNGPDIPQSFYSPDMVSISLAIHAVNSVSDLSSTTATEATVTAGFVPDSPDLQKHMGEDVVEVTAVSFESDVANQMSLDNICTNSLTRAVWSSLSTYTVNEKKEGGPTELVIPEVFRTPGMRQDVVSLVIVEGGEYLGGFDVRGQPLVVRFRGDVSFSAPTEKIDSQPVLDMVIPTYSDPTNISNASINMQRRNP